MTVRSFFKPMTVAMALVSSLPVLATDKSPNAPMLNHQPAPLVDLTSSTSMGGSATIDPADQGAPLVDTTTKKKKPAPSFWSKLVHPTTWFSSSKK